MLSVGVGENLTLQSPNAVLCSWKVICVRAAAVVSTSVAASERDIQILNMKEVVKEGKNLYKYKCQKSVMIITVSWNLTYN